MPSRICPVSLDNASQMLTLTCQSLLNVWSLLWQSRLVDLVRSTAHELPGMQAHPFFAGIGWDALAERASAVCAHSDARAGHPKL